jgi:hypothetical protein
VGPNSGNQVVFNRGNWVVPNRGNRASGNTDPDETIRIQLEARMSTTVEPLPHLRFEIPEAARILRISRAAPYERIREGLITTQKDGRRTFITAAELQRYVIPRS